ncbi:hypothetical protein H2203_009224 [Taxawa tesnikishii (nom. ined.)]|nr:hypothetical protein H2203_009224 [Dothideales sp. JES 119]
MPEESFPILANGTTHHIELSQHWPGQGDSNEAASQSTPVRPHQSTQAWQNGNGYSLHPENAPSPRVSPNARGRNGLPRLNLSPNGDGMRAPSAVSVSEHLIEVSPLNSAPLLSPVAELRTPSPTSSKGLESPKQQPQGLAKAAQIANGKLAEDANTSRQGYKVSKARDGPTALNQSINPAGMATHENSKPQALPSNQSNPWQQATRKGHKKSKSVAGAKNASGLKTGGEPIPAHEADRKGG